MKRIKIFIGSPRKKGNTHSLAEILQNRLHQKKSCSEISFLYDYEIKPCVDCRACKKDRMECVLDDDMARIYARLESSDILIIGTPIYWFGPSAKTKLMLDRLRPYFANKRLTGKSGALLLPAGTGETDCDLTIEMFKRSFEALGIAYIGAVTAKAYDTGEAKKDKGAMTHIDELSARINEAL